MKIKIIEIPRDKSGYCYECGNNFGEIRGITKWDEVTDEEYQKINLATINANQTIEGSKYYILITQTEDRQELFDTAAQWVEYEKQQQLKWEQENKSRAAKCAETVLKRKHKQLEKLKKELENGTKI